MVKHNMRLDSVFGSLSDPTRRDILKRVAKRELSVGDIAEPYRVSLAAISKHLHVLERAKLIEKRRRGKQHFIRLSPRALQSADEYLRRYKELWEERLDRLEEALKDN